MLRHCGHSLIMIAGILSTTTLPLMTIVKALLQNADKARALIRSVAPRVRADDVAACQCSCRGALQYAILTAPEARAPGTMDKLSAVAGCVLK